MNDPLLKELLTHTDNDDTQKQYFAFQLDCLKLEIGLVDQAIGRASAKTQTIKNFAIATWAGVVTIFLSQADLRKFFGVTIFIPLLFWFIDAWWTSRSRSARLRLKKISEFLNSETLFESFKQQKLVNFILLDILGRQYKGSQEYEKASGFKYIIWYKEIVFLYGGLMGLSLFLAVLLSII